MGSLSPVRAAHSVANRGGLPCKTPCTMPSVDSARCAHTAAIGAALPDGCQCAWSDVTSATVPSNHHLACLTASRTNATALPPADPAKDDSGTLVVMTIPLRWKSAPAYAAWSGRGQRTLGTRF